MPSPRQFEFLGKCVECGLIESFTFTVRNVATLRDLAEYIRNYHCQTHRQVTEAELLALEAEGLQ